MPPFVRVSGIRAIPGPVPVIESAVRPEVVIIRTLYAPDAFNPQYGPFFPCFVTSEKSDLPIANAILSAVLAGAAVEHLMAH